MSRLHELIAVFKAGWKAGQRPDPKQAIRDRHALIREAKEQAQDSGRDK